MDLWKFNEFRDTYEEIHGKGYKVVAPQEYGIAGYGTLEAFEIKDRIFQNDNTVLLTKIGFRTTDKRRFFLENVVYLSFSHITRDKQGQIKKANIDVTTRETFKDPLDGDDISMYRTFVFKIFC